MDTSLPDELDRFLHLDIEKKEGVDCDGCNETIPPGEEFLTNIQSCCGSGCVRSLCKECVRYAYSLIIDDKRG